MSSLIATFRELCQFRRGPQDLPYAPRLLAALMLASLLARTSAGQLFATPEAPVSPLRAALATLFVLALLHTLLSLRRFANRFVQTALAWSGLDLIFLALSLPLLLGMGKPPTSPEAMTPAQLVLMWPLLALMIWKLAVQVHVLRQALEVRLAAAILIALLVDLGVSVVFGA